MIAHSEALDLLGPALAAAQAEMEHASKNANNPHFRSKYADLPEVIDTVGPVLAKHGFSVVQLPGWEDGICTLDTMLLHKSGQWIRGTAGSPIAKQDAQGVGSAVTYLRRYSLAALCRIAQEDDDGNAAAGGQRQEQESRPAPRRSGSPEDVLVPFGKSKGKRLGDLDDQTLNSFHTFVSDKPNMKDLKDAAEAVGRARMGVAA